MQQWDKTRLLLRKPKVPLLDGRCVRYVDEREVAEKTEGLKDIPWD
jgi:hypothetical protein